MREIKFRAWLKNEKKMVDVEDIGFKHQIIGYIEKPCFYGDATFEDIELMQFTGLYDKNGKEIYEGDIVDMGFKCFVKYSQQEGAFRLCDLEDEYNIWLTVLEGRRNEVIGNIYENGDLL